MRPCLTTKQTNKPKNLEATKRANWDGRGVHGPMWQRSTSLFLELHSDTELAAAADGTMAIMRASRDGSSAPIDEFVQWWPEP